MKRAKKEGIEERLRALEEIVNTLEDGTLPLEESLSLFEKGIRLSRELQTSLEAASLRVTRLLDGSDSQEVPLDEGPPAAGPPPESTT